MDLSLQFKGVMDVQFATHQEESSRLWRSGTQKKNDVPARVVWHLTRKRHSLFLA